MSKILNLKETYKWHKYDYEETKKKKELWLYYLRNFPLFSGQFSEPLLSKGLSPLSFRFLECLPLFLWPPVFNLTRMHFDEASGPSTTSVTRNLKFCLKKLCIAWKTQKVRDKWYANTELGEKLGIYAY